MPFNFYARFSKPILFGIFLILLNQFNLGSCGNLNSTKEITIDDNGEHFQYSWTSANTTFFLKFIPMNCIVYAYVTYTNAHVFYTVYNGATIQGGLISVGSGFSFPGETGARQMVPRGSAFSFNVSKEIGFVDGQTHAIDIYIETANITVDSSPKQLSPGTGELVDFAATQTNSSRTYAAGNSSIYAIMACDNSEVGNFYFQEDCNRLMFFKNDSKFIGSATYLWMSGSSILSDNSTSSLTLYESYIADLYAQVFFYSPKNADFNFDKYSVGWQNESVFLNVTDRFAAEIRFAKLNPNYQKCIQYVSFSDKNNSRLYVYSGVQEILNTDNMPTDNLVYVIYPNETIALSINYPLTESIYTFVAVNGSVDYRIDNSWSRNTAFTVSSDFTASFDSSTSPTTHSIQIESTTKFSSTNSSSFMLFVVIYLVKALYNIF